MSGKKIQRSNMTQTDDKGRVLREPRDNSSPQGAKLMWWRVPEKERAAAIAGTIKFIKTNQPGRIEYLTDLTRLYDNTSIYNYLSTGISRAASGTANPMGQRLTFNLISSVVDTLTSKMAKNKVIPSFVTNGGIWKYQKRAKQLNKFAQGIGYQLKIHDKCITGFNDAGVWGDGFTHVFRKDNKCAIERVYPHEITVDQIDGLSDDPRQLHREKIMSRDVACEAFPELEESILSANPLDHNSIGGHATAADLVTVTESYHLRSGEEADDGMRVISIGDGSLTDEWNKDYFPFPHFKYSTRKTGYYGKGAAERLQTIQCEINRNMMLKQRALWMQSAFKVLIENGSKIVTQHLNNEVGTIITYTGVPPQYITPPAVNPEIQEWIDSLIQKGFLQEGVSQLSAAAEKPLGVDSGKGLRTITDIEDDRFTYVSQQMEDFVLENYRQAIDVVKDIYQDKKTYEAVFPTTNFLETVDWKDINLDDDCYVLRAYPVSSLADDIAGRLSDIQELAQAGFISQRTARKLMNMPDVEMNDSLSNAAEDYLHKILEKMIYDEEYTAPDQFMDLALAVQLFGEYHNYASYMNAPQNVLGLLEQFNAAVNDLNGTIAQAQQTNAIAAQAMQAQQQAASQPPANPTATPTSNLIPNTNSGGVAA